MTMKIIVYRQIKGKISLKAVSHLFACFLLQAFDSQRKLRNKNFKMFWSNNINSFCVCASVSSALQ